MIATYFVLVALIFVPSTSPLTNNLTLQGRDQLNEDHQVIPTCAIQNDTICFDAIHHIIKEPF